MPYDWLAEPIIAPPPFRPDADQRAVTRYRQVVQEHAAMLLRLGWSRQEAAGRCRDRLLMRQPLHTADPFLREVDAIVDEVYRGSRR